MIEDQKSQKYIKIALIVFFLAIVFLISLQFSSQHDIQKNKTNRQHITSEETYNLPIITIDVLNKNINTTTKVKAKLKIYDSKTGINKLSDKPKKEYNILIRIRGNSTRLVPKKQYRIHLMDKNFKKTQEKKFLGMPTASEWILNAPFEDKSLIRNRIAYKIANKIMGWAPDTRYCNVFVRQANQKGPMKNYFKGLYLAIQPIERAQNKVNIHQSDPKSPQTSFIIQSNRLHQGTQNDPIVDSYGKENYIYDYPFIINYPKQTLTKRQEKYIAQTISLLERSLYKTNPDNEYQKYINEDTFVDYYIINEFFKNTDAGLLSTYMYKDFGGKINAGPVWDFNAAMGNSDLLSPYYDYKGFYMPRTPIFGKLIEHKEFAEKVIERYRFLRKNYLNNAYIDNLIDKNTKELNEAQQKNFKVWPIWLCNQFEMFKEYPDVFKKFGDNVSQIKKFVDKNPRYLQSTENMAISYQQEIKKLKTFIKNRGYWMDKNIENLKKISDQKNESNE